MIINNSTNGFIFGSAERSITPKQYKGRSLTGYGRWKKCDGIHDLIYVRCYVFSKNDEISLVLLNYDLTGLTFINNVELKRRIHLELNIDPKKIHTYCTHTHHAPGVMGIMPAPVFPAILYRDVDEPYFDLLAKQTIASIDAAMEKQIPIKIGYDKIQNPERNAINRRSPPGKLIYLHPYIHIIRIDDMEDRIVGLISIFPAHPTILSGLINEITPGWPGFYVQYLKKGLDSIVSPQLPFIPMHFQGPAGNVAPGYPKPIRKDLLAGRELTQIPGKERGFLVSRSFAADLADKVMKKAINIPTSPFKRIIIDFKEILLSLKPVYRKLDRDGWKSIFVAGVKAVLFFPLLFILRRGRVSFVNLVRTHVKGKKWKKLKVKTAVTTIGFNDFLIAGSPGEPYNNIEKEIRTRTGHPKLAVAELCNDSIGYNWTDVDLVYSPSSYEGNMSSSPLIGIWTRNALIKEIKKISQIP